MAPVVDDLAHRYQGRVLVAKVNTDMAQRTSSDLRIGAIPTTIVFKGGKEVTRHTGAAPAPVLEQLVAKAM
jgi:thioredoxin-like negative regulator of GroEL